MVEDKEVIIRHFCLRCGHEWIGRAFGERKANQPPMKCPNCTSERWNKPRKDLYCTVTGLTQDKYFCRVCHNFFDRSQMGRNLRHCPKGCKNDNV